MNKVVFLRCNYSLKMNKLSREKQIQIVSSLCEGNSIRATVRMTGASKNTIVKLLVDLGTACAAYHNEHVCNLTAKRIQCDEIWSFVYAKQKNVPQSMKDTPGVGDVWTWVALDADTKLVLSYLVGERTLLCADLFMHDVKARLTNRVQLTTDGHKAYLNAVDNVFGADIDYAMLVKMYGNTPEGMTHRYSPAECTGARKDVITGKPDTKHVSTSYVERQNLTMRMNIRRFTRLTNAFSKKIENHEHAIALFYMYYNFVRIHQTTRVTPAMAAGVTSHLWDIGNIVDLLK